MSYPFPTGPRVPPRVLPKMLSMAGGYMFNGALLQKGELIDEHVHPLGHPTYIGAGRARLWVDKVWVGDYGQGDAVELAAGKYHAFEALEDNTLITCVWEEKVGEQMLKGDANAV